MGKNRARAKAVWDTIANLWLVKDLGIAIGLWTFLGAILSPLVVWAFTPASPIDLLVVMIVGGLVTFFLARHFAPKMRNIHHLALPAQTAPVASLDMVITRAPARDTALIDALAYVVTGTFDRKRVVEEYGGISTLGRVLQEFLQDARDGKLHVWGKAENWSVYDPIPADYWSNHKVDFLELFREEADVEHGTSPFPHYKELRVSKAEFEGLWPKPA